MNLDLNELKKVTEQLKDQPGKGGGDEFLKNFVKMPEGKGKVVVRFLPPAKAGLFGNKKNPFYLHTRVHRVNDKNVHCRRELVDGKLVGDCPVCKYLRNLWTESNSAAPQEQERMRQLYRDIKAIDRYYYNVVVRNVLDEATGTMCDSGPKILAVGKTLHQMILTGIVGDPEMEVEGLGDVTDLKNGRDFKIMKTIKKGADGTFPEYSGSHFVDAVGPLADPDLTAQYIENLHNLSSLRIVKSYDEVDHELLCHLGLAEKEKQDKNWDASKYKTNFGDASSQKENTKVSVSVPANVPAAKSAPEPEEAEEDNIPRPMPDEDFINELRGV